MSNSSVRYAFDAAGALDGPRLIVATGGFRRPGWYGDPLGVQIEIARVGSIMGGLVANITRQSWVDGLRYLAARDVLPVAELALPRGLTPEELDYFTLDPGKVADEFAATTVEHLRASRVVEAPPGHEFWSTLRRYIGQSFYVGWFSHRTFGGGKR